jgi:hypothetical protein
MEFRAIFAKSHRFGVVIRKGLFVKTFDVALAWVRKDESPRSQAVGHCFGRPLAFFRLKPPLAKQLDWPPEPFLRRIVGPVWIKRFAMLQKNVFDFIAASSIAIPLFPVDPHSLVKDKVKLALNGYPPIVPFVFGVATMKVEDLFFAGAACVRIWTAASSLSIGEKFSGGPIVAAPTTTWPF